MTRALSYYRNLYYWATTCNALSFNLIGGNLVMLFLVEIHASDTSKGLISAMGWFALTCLAPGKFFLRRIGVVKTMGALWISRSLAITPMALAVVLFGAGVLNLRGTVLLTVLGQAGFQVLRGIGMSSNSPMFYHLTNQDNRTRFLTHLQVLSNIAAMVVLLFSSWMFRLLPSPFHAYATFYFLGAGLGIFVGILYFQLQEPQVNSTEQQEPLSKTLADLFRARNSRIFLSVYAAVSFVSSTAIGFLIVFLREVSSLDDSMLLLYALGGPAGMVLVGMALSPLLDRIGPKPFTQIYIAILAFVCLAAMMHPFIPSSHRPLLYIILFAGTTLGAAGGSSSLQAYFFNTIYRANNINLGIILHLAQATGGLGLIAGGMLLDLLQAFSISTTIRYNIFFLFLLSILALALYLSRKLEKTGDFGMIRTLKVLFSPREWYGLWLLGSLNRQPVASRERSILSQIERSGARHIVADDYFRRLNAPDLLIREEVLSGMRAIPLNESMKHQLIEHMEKSPFTTAAPAANTLGLQRVQEAIPALRRGLASVDHNLKAEAALALARIGDTASLPLIRQALFESRNQRVVIYTINAVKILGQFSQDAPTLIQLWQRWHNISQIEREVTLALARLLRCEDRFSPRYFELCERKTPCWQHLWQKHFKPDGAPAEQQFLVDSSAPVPTWLQDQPTRTNLAATLLRSLHSAAPQHPVIQLANPNNPPYWQQESGLFLLLFLTVLQKNN